jgi:hypothetical protein
MSGILNELEIEAIHNQYKNDYLYKKTMAALSNLENQELLKKYCKNFINYTYDINIDAKNIYNKMLTNFLNKNIVDILDNIFDKIEITKENIFYHGFSPNPKFNLSTLFENNIYNEQKMFDKIYELHSDLNKACIRKSNDDIKCPLYDISKWFSDEKNKGALYTTSCFDKNDTINNIKLSLSSKYFNNTLGDIKLLAIFVPKSNYKLYNLHPENFRQRILFKRILTNILFEGKFNFGITLEELKQMETTKDRPNMFVSYPYTCQSILEQKNIDKDCIHGYWDGDNTLDEAIINHFVNIYNKRVPIDRKIIGYIGRDNGYDQKLNTTINIREFVWFENESCLQIAGFYLKNRLITNIYEFYSAIHDHVKKSLVFENGHYIFNADTPIDVTNDDLNIMIEKLCNIRSFAPDFINNRKFDVDEILDKNQLQQKILSISQNPIYRLFDEKDPMHKNIILRGGENIYKNKYIKYKNKYINAKYRN